jgi:hypothetical protein
MIALPNKLKNNSVIALGLILGMYKSRAARLAEAKPDRVPLCVPACYYVFRFLNEAVMKKPVTF